MSTKDYLKEILNYVKEQVPYYMSLNLENASLEHYPIITKKFLKTNIHEFVSNESLTDKQMILSELLQTFDESTIEKKINSHITIEKTSGSSGFPFLTAKYNKDRISMGKLLWRYRKKIIPGIKVSDFLAINHSSDSVIECSPYNFGIDNLICFYEEVRNSKKTIIHMQGQILKIHIDLLTLNNVRLEFPDLRYIECNGNYLNLSDKNEIEEYFNVKVYNQYGLLETWPIGLACENNNFHLFDDLNLVELVNERNEVITECGCVGRIVATNLHSRIIPFIRYDTGDYGIYIDKTCNCDFDSRNLQIIHNRSFNIIKGNDEKLFGIMEIEKILSEMENITSISLPLAFQVYQNTDVEFTILLSRVNELGYFLSTFSQYIERVVQRKIILNYMIIPDNEVQKFLQSIDKNYIFINYEVKDYLDKYVSYSCFRYQEEEVCT